jgi:transposase
MRVLGLDVSKDNVTCCLISRNDCLAEPRKIYTDKAFPRLYANAKGIAELLAMSPDVAVLEPTGVNYSKIWCQRLASAGVRVVLVGHTQLRYHRIALGLPDKDDEADSLALAHYFITYQGDISRFVRERDPVVAAMREKVLRLHHCNRVQSPIINRLRQDLAWQYPEGCKRGLNGRLFWRWLAGSANSLKYDHELANTIGAGIGENTRFLAMFLEKWHRHEEKIERELRELMQDARFLPYRQVMATYGMGNRCQALLISQIFPLDNYLKNGQMETILTRSRTNPSRKTRKHVSQRRFLKALGVAPQRENSGDKTATKKAGSELCRTALWQWCFTRIEVNKNRPKSERMAQICNRFDELKTKMPIKKARAKICAIAAGWLIQDLCKALKTQP